MARFSGNPGDIAGGGGSGVSMIASADGSITVTNPMGPTVDLAVADPNTDDLTWSFSRPGNVSAGSPLNMAGGLSCSSVGRAGMMVTRNCTLTRFGWRRSDADAGTLRIELYRAGVIQATATAAVGIGVPEAVATISIAAQSGDLIGAFVGPGSANTLSNVIIRVRGELP